MFNTLKNLSVKNAFIVVLVILGLLTPLFLFIVHESKQVIVIRFGQFVRSVNTEGDDSGPGLKFKFPWERVVAFDKRILTLNLPAKEVLASDQERLVVDAFTRYRIRDPLAFYRTVGSELKLVNRLSRIVESALRRTLGSTESEVIISDAKNKLMVVLTKLIDDAAKGISATDDVGGLSKELAGSDIGIDILDVRITRADLPAANMERVFERMRTERQQQATLFRSEGKEKATQRKANADRESDRILNEAIRRSEEIKGEGDGESARIYAQAHSYDPSFYSFYRSMLAYKNVSKEMTFVLSADMDFFEYLR